jgi:hypothetical protein
VCPLEEQASSWFDTGSRSSYPGGAKELFGERHLADWTTMMVFLAAVELGSIEGRTAVNGAALRIRLRPNVCAC